jgi:hypothetical protein
MKHQWKIKRTAKEYQDGKVRWDRAYQLLLEIAQTVEEQKNKERMEVEHASSDICESIDAESGAKPNH